MGEILEVTVERLGSQGDGTAHCGEQTLHIPFALPGERVRVQRDGLDRARLVDVLEASPERTAPLCPHYGVCGGCNLQHVSETACLAWKQAKVAAAFAARGLDVPVPPVLAFPQARRRRAVLAARRSGRGVVLGFHAARGHDLVPIAECPVLEPAIEQALPGLTRLAALLAPAPGRGELRLTVLHARNGLDAAVSGAAPPRDPAASAAVAAAAEAAGLLRLTVSGGVLLLRETPSVTFGPAQVTPPPGAFVQAMAAAESAMARLAVDAAKGARYIADLFCGLGAFTFPLAVKSRVLAIDSSREAVAALAAAARRTPGVKPIGTRVRDLFREPLSPLELREFGAVVLDPPRAGAQAQCAALARSQVPAAVLISCDPGTLARDVRTLADGGYRLDTVTPFDQFRYSPHVETVAVLRR